MKRKLISIMFALFIVISGCSTNNENCVIDSKTCLNISVPKGLEATFQVHWYRLSEDNYNVNNEFNHDFIVGDNVELIGENVEQLKGASIMLSQTNLSDMISDEYYTTLLLEEDHTYDGNKYKLINNEFIYPSDEEIKKTRELLAPYISSTKIIQCSLYFNGTINDRVTVRNIEISDIGFSFDFDTFNISPSDLPSDQTGEIIRLMDFSSYGALLSGPSMSEIGYYFVEGSALDDIKEISLLSLNEYCTVVTNKNHGDYESYERQNDTTLYREQKTTNFIAGDKISIEFDFLFDGVKDIKKYDSTIACFANVFTKSDGTKLYSYVYETSMRDPQYALVHLLHDLR